MVAQPASTRGATFSAAPTLIDRVYAELAARLADGRLRRGDRLPPERQLCRELDVSRVTLRRALAQLRDEGALQSVRGAGTFVTSPVLGEPQNNLLSFSRLSLSRGLRPSADLLNLDVRPATIEEGERCGIAPGTAVVSLERIRRLDDIPIAVSRSLIPLACAPTMLEVDWTTASLYDELSKSGNQPVRADYAIEAQGADHKTAALLKVGVGQPVLVVASTSYTSEGRAVEVGHMIYRGDRYRFRSSVPT
jgi:GntR family transcriptional regulator